MTTVAEHSTTYFTGFCGLRADAASHARCPRQLRSGEREWTCCCPCHLEPPGGDVNAVDVPAKDTLQAGPLSPAGVPASPPPDVEYDLGDALLHLVQSVDVLGRALLDFDGNQFELLDLLGHVRRERQNLADLEAVLERDAARAMTDDHLEWAGGSAERRWGKDRKEWKHDELVRVVTARIVERLAVDPASGEYDDTVAALLRQGLDEYAATNRPSWRVTAVKPLGIDPDEFCTAVPGRPTVQVHLADGEQ